MNITIIGGGNMGLTYALSVHTNFKDTNISILEKDASKIEQLKKDTPFNVYSDPCLLYTSPSPRDGLLSRMPSSA